MHQRLLQSFAIHADDTPLVLLRPRRTAYAWVYLGDADNPYTLFDFTAGRSQNFRVRSVNCLLPTCVTLGVFPPRRAPWRRFLGIRFGNNIGVSG